MDDLSPDGKGGAPILALDEDGVAAWFAALGFPWYDAQIRGASVSGSSGLRVRSDLPARAEHGITGPILVHLDHEALKDVGIHSVGQRLAVLKAVYALKVAQNVPVEEGHYVPPCACRCRPFARIADRRPLALAAADELDQMMVDSPRGFLPQQQILTLLHERGQTRT